MGQAFKRRLNQLCRLMPSHGVPKKKKNLQGPQADFLLSKKRKKNHQGRFSDSARWRLVVRGTSYWQQSAARATGGGSNKRNNLMCMRGRNHGRVI